MFLEFEEVPADAIDPSDQNAATEPRFQLLQSPGTVQMLRVK
jgi:hypothetical protein